MNPRVPDPPEMAENIMELRQAIEQSTKQTREAIDRLADRIERAYVSKEVFDLTTAPLIGRVEKVEESQKWIARTAVTALILPILVSVVAAIILAGAVT